MIEDKKKTNQDNYISPGIFKAYDIRGKYPEEVNERVAYFIGRAFVKFIRSSREDIYGDGPTIVVGQDNRLSSPSLFNSLVKGINYEGGKVIDIGMSTTPMLYFSSAHYGFDGGIVISASHNPSRYNGFKLVKKGAVPVSGETGIKEIKSIVEEIYNETQTLETKVVLVKKDILSDYLDFNFSFSDANSFGKFKVVVDTANAVSGILIPEISRRTQLEIYHLFSELDGSFPNHNPDPLIENNLKALNKEILAKGADMGIAFDGDGDRIVFLNEKGEVVPADLILALLSKYILKNNPGRKILYDIRSSNAVKEAILENGGESVIGRVGHSFIKEKMRKDNIIFAGEFSGHFYHQEHYFSEAPLFVFLKIIEILLFEKKLFSEVISPFKKYWHSGEINFNIENKKEKIAQLKEKYKDGRIFEIDGLRVDFARWWFLVRASNTEPLLRLIVEAKDKELMEEKIRELGQFISS